MILPAETNGWLAANKQQQSSPVQAISPKLSKTVAARKQQHPLNNLRWCCWLANSGFYGDANNLNLGQVS